MRALSIRQPWAWLILHAGKDIENRPWATHYRGRVLIHAAKGMTRAEYLDAAEALRQITGDRITLPPSDDLPRGGIVGSVDIVDCVTASSSQWFRGRFGFALRNATPSQFIPLRGLLGLFNEPDDIEVRHAA